MSCEDWPCCGHEFARCPNVEDGEQTNKVCICGEEVPVNNRSSLCDECLQDARDDFDDYFEDRN
jgi:hypothetical protein